MISCVAVSSDTVAVPDPVDVLGGTSDAAVSVALNFTVAADAVPASRTAMLAIANERRSMKLTLFIPWGFILSSQTPQRVLSGRVRPYGPRRYGPPDVIVGYTQRAARQTLRIGSADRLHRAGR